MKDYYNILGLESSASDAEIRKKYRKLALQFHPDRNPDNPESEERFKEIAEAYGVLMDPVKKNEYEAARRFGFNQQTGSRSPNGSSFQYSQEDILRDMMNDPRFQGMFQGLFREFQRSGFRSDHSFVRHTFFGGRSVFLGGLVVIGSMVAPALLGKAGMGRLLSGGIIKGLGHIASSYLAGAKAGVGKPEQPVSDVKNLDLTYHLQLSPLEFATGKMVQVAVQGLEEQELYKVNIPAQSKPGRRLRLQGKGKIAGQSRGDLYISLEVE